MLGHENNQLYIDNNNLWESFLSRCRDSSADVRNAFLKAVPSIMRNHDEDVGNQVSDALFKISRDPSSDVRKEAVKTMEAIGMLNFRLISSEILEALKERTRDTNVGLGKNSCMSLLIFQCFSGALEKQPCKRVQPGITNFAMRKRTQH